MILSIGLLPLPHISLIKAFKMSIPMALIQKNKIEKKSALSPPYFLRKEIWFMKLMKKWRIALHS